MAISNAVRTAGGPPSPRRAGANADAQLLPRLLEVLAYAGDGLAQLDAYARVWSERREDEADAFFRRRDKVAAEALLLAYLASRVPEPDAALAAAVERLAAAAEEQIASARNEALLRRFPQTALSLGLGFVLLGQLGRGRPAVERRLVAALRGGRAGFTERGAYRLMDSRWTYGLLDPGLLGPPEELLPFSTLAASPHPLHTMSADDYALTHAIFYLTDFGRRAAPAPLHENANRLLDPYVGWSAVQLDYDLLGEFLITSLALAAPASPASRFGWEVLERAWKADEGLVGPEYSPARFAELAGLEAEAYAFSENYHTVFVGGILCAVGLSLPRPESGAWRRARPADLPELAARCLAAAALAGAPAADARVAVAVPGPEHLPEWTAARLLQVTETPAEPPPLWLAAAAESSLSRGELSGVLHDALLVGAARRYRLVQLAQALLAAAGQSELRSPTFARALGFLLDQQLEDGSIGIHRLLAETGAADAAPGAQAALAGLLHGVGTALATT